MRQQDSHMCFRLLVGAQVLLGIEANSIVRGRVLSFKLTQASLLQPNAMEAYFGNTRCACLQRVLAICWCFEALML